MKDESNKEKEKPKRILKAEAQKQWELEEALEKIKKNEDLEKLRKPHGSAIEEYITQGEYVYELFSILIHAGIAQGGHYYTYIKSFEDGKWYNFNDSHVTEIEQKNLNDVISKSFGGESESAYMLQYRKYNPTLSKIEEGSEALKIEIPNELCPLYQRKDIDAETQQLLKEQLELE